MVTCWFGCSNPVAHNWVDDCVEPGTAAYPLAKFNCPFVFGAGPNEFVDVVWAWSIGTVLNMVTYLFVGLCVYVALYLKRAHREHS